MRVNNQDNPLVANTGISTSDNTIIYSDFTNGRVDYQIMRRDEQPIYPGVNTISVSTVDGSSAFADVNYVGSNRLEILLSFRTKYKVRNRRNLGAWSSWFNFTTRDKTYKTPDAITYESIGDDTNPQQKNNKRITVTNNAKATTAYTARGATVTNTDNGFNGTTSITPTSRGATVITQSF